MSREAPGVLRYLRRVLDDPQAQGVGDADLLQRFVAQRDESAFELLLWRHAGMVLSVCRSILRDHHLAEDAFQATFLALARKAGSIGRRDVVAGWLHRVAHNAALKARGRQVRDHVQPLTSEPLAPADHSEVDLAPLLHEELGRLPDKYRTPLVLCFLEGLSHTDAARLLGWPKGTVAGRVARARDLLRKRLTRRGIVLSAALLGTPLTVATASAVPPTLVATTAQAALAFVSGSAAGLVSAPVLRLTEGVLHAMFLSKLKSLAVVLSLVGCVLLGAGFLGGWALAQKPSGGPGDPKPAGAGAPPAKQAEDAAVTKELRLRSVNNLKHLALAVHNYHDVYLSMPNNLLDANKKPLLSWRVLLLPFMEQEALYKQFKLDEPWDSENNLKLLAKMPDVYKTGVEARDTTSTFYQGFADLNSMFPPDQKLRIRDVPDGTSNTILIIEAGVAVPWTKPIDLPYTSNNPLPKLGGPFGDVIHAAFVDGAVHTLKKDFDEAEMRKAIQRDDGWPIDLDKLHAKLPPEEPAKPSKPANEEELKRALEQALAARDQAVLAEKLAQAQREQAEVLKQEARRAQEVAEEMRRQSEDLKQENERLKAALRGVAAQLNKLVPADTPNKPAAPPEVKALAAELERTRDELQRLRQDVERLKKALDK